jgi:Fe2+ or Zn2+ uptake regulation protein
MRTPDELTEEFRRRGLKVTPQRTAVFRVLHGDQTHPTAEAVHRRVVQDMPTVSLRTVYQTLNDLTAMGEIRNLDVGTGSARFDPNVESAHDHAVCDACGSVRDIPAAAPTVHPRDLPEGFRAHAAEVVVRGTCASCAESAERSTVAAARA